MKKKFRNFLLSLMKRIKDHDTATMASSLSYYYMAAFIPLLFLIINLISRYVSGNHEMLVDILSILPKSTRELVNPAIESLIAASKTSTVSNLSLIFILWSASNAVSRLLYSINVAYGVKKNNLSILDRIFGFAYTFLLLLIIAVLVGLRLYSKRIFVLFENFLSNYNLGAINSSVKRFVDLINGIFPMLIIIIALAFLYKQAPSKNKSYKISIPEALLAGGFSSISIFIISYLYSYFLENLSNMSAIYGALAGFIAMFLWIFLFSYVLILGAEMLACFKELKVKRSQKRIRQK